MFDKVQGPLLVLDAGKFWYVRRSQRSIGFKVIIDLKWSNKYG